MIVFKIMLIILVALPVIATASALYIHLLRYVNSKNKEDKAAGRK